MKKLHILIICSSMVAYIFDYYISFRMISMVYNSFKSNYFIQKIIEMELH